MAQRRTGARWNALRTRARRLVEAGGASRAAIAANLGVSPSTLRRWIVRHGWGTGGGVRGAAASQGPSQAPSKGPSPARWAAARRLFERIDADGAEAAADLAIVLDLPAARAEAALAEHGLARRDGAPDSTAPPCCGGCAAMSGARSRRSTRLAERPRAPDSGRVLRDVAGLKRVLDELREEGEGADAGARPDLDGLREAIARRYESFEGNGAAAPLPRDAA